MRLFFLFVFLISLCPAHVLGGAEPQAHVLVQPQTQVLVEDQDQTRLRPDRGVVLVVPASPSSIPLILAARSLENPHSIKVKVFHNHSRAHALFLRGEVQLLSTGLGVGVRFFNQKVPIKIISSHVAGLSYLVTTRTIKGFKELRGQKLWLPFPGSPLEELSRFFAECEGLIWKSDILVGYSMFDSSVKLLKMHKIDFLPLPEPFVTLATENSNLTVSLDFGKLWEQYTGKGNPCPQVGTFINTGWKGDNIGFVREFNRAVEQAVSLCMDDPDLAIKKTQSILGFPKEVLEKALTRTRFQLLTDQKLKDGVFAYYNTIGSPLDQSFEDFF